jgi:uncharacterized OB-fold protein
MVDQKCPKGGEHVFEPIWFYDLKVDDYNFIDQKCEKCGEIK